MFSAPQRQRGLAPHADVVAQLADAASQRRMVATIAPAGFFKVEQQPISLGATNLTPALPAAVSGSALANLQTKAVDTTAASPAATATVTTQAPTTAATTATS